MKILFLTGSLEPAKDGVGDYTYCLSAECERLGHSCYLVGLNDRWVQAPVRSTRGVRLPANLSWWKRADVARAFLDEVQPEIVSLQFVPYSYHPMGLNLALPWLLRKIINKRRAQIMFHEVWIGANQGAPARARFIGAGQRKIIERIVEALSPCTVHTSNEVYRQLLARRGIDSQILPMFGSIPIVEEDPRRLKSPVEETALCLCLFGAIHPEWSADGLLSRLQKVSQQIQFFHIGRMGSGEPVWQKLVDRYDQQFIQYGERSPEEISQLFRSANFGIATTPLALIDKSSSIAAILEHGLPVIVTRNDVHFEGVQSTSIWADRLIELDDQFFERFNSLKKLPPRARAAQVAVQFLADIGA
jgi:hypothetical protein